MWELGIWVMPVTFSSISNWSVISHTNHTVSSQISAAFVFTLTPLVVLPPVSSKTAPPQSVMGCLAQQVPLPSKTPQVPIAKLVITYISLVYLYHQSAVTDFNYTVTNIHFIYLYILFIAIVMSFTWVYFLYLGFIYVSILVNKTNKITLNL